MLSQQNRTAATPCSDPSPPLRRPSSSRPALGRRESPVAAPRSAPRRALQQAAPLRSRRRSSRHRSPPPRSVRSNPPPSPCRSPLRSWWRPTQGPLTFFVGLRQVFTLFYLRRSVDPSRRRRLSLSLSSIDASRSLSFEGFGGSRWIFVSSWRRWAGAGADRGCRTCRRR